MATNEVVIRTVGLGKSYDEHVAVRSLDLEIRQGEVFGLLGPNGAGKTTSILMLLGLTEPTGGTAEVLGLDPARNPLAVKRHVGYLPDNVGFYGPMSGRDNLRYTARLNGIESKAATARVDHLLSVVGLSDAAGKAVETYSRGMRQRLGLADALVKSPSVAILDEPTASIDPVGVIEILELVRSLARDEGVTILLSSHLLHQVQQVCDRIAIFVAGDVVAMGTVAELAARQARGASVVMELGVTDEPSATAVRVRALPGVQSVDLDPQDHRLLVVAMAPEAKSSILSSLLAGGIVPWLVRDRGMELDEIYQRYFIASGAEVAA
jgi:ABC-2 type transport system ATP-binding protein